MDARLLRASAFIESKTRFGDALEDLDFVLSREPANLDGLVDRISVLIALGRIEEAARSLEDLEATETDSRGGAALVAQVCTVRAMFSAERGLVEEATSRFRECRKRHPD
ncbi:MAG TPA: tetratricopeptide repeat protein, partial [Myxococcota bacterium]|nr:tetratricopeptide repeat protein [Myxococcota bacterium]